MAEIEIRLATDSANDVASVAAQLREMDCFYGDTAPDQASVERFVRDTMLAPGAATNVALALDGDTILGSAFFVLIGPSDPLKQLLYLKDIFVNETARGKGVGEKFMRFLARHAIARGCSRIDLTTGTDNPARAFYDRLGGEVDPNRVFYRFSEPALRDLAGA